MSNQIIKCEGCGSKWVVIGIGSQIVTRLAECPLCAKKEVDSIE